MLRRIALKPVTLVVVLILTAGFILRVYRVDKILGFYYDQGRDALVIWDLWHKGKLFLVGPTTGIAGIFRGPFYYYLVAPFYLLGKGDPAWPAVFLAFTTVLASALAFYLGKKIHSTPAGIFALIISSFSFNIVMASRWLSNPTPMLLLSMILVWMMILVTEKKAWAWVVISLVAGLSLFHFGSSGEFFYFPSLAIFAVWQYKNLPGKKIFALSFLTFFITALPLVVFDLRHEGILRNNISQFLFGEKSFGGITKFIFQERLKFYWDTFSNKIFLIRQQREIGILTVVGAYFLAVFSKLFKSNGVKIIILLLISPLIGLFFFQGNYGNIYDYYLTGYYLIFILLFSIVLGEVYKTLPGKIFLIYFFGVFFVINFKITFYKVTAGSDGPETIVLENQKEAIDWIYKDASGREFNVDVYVPPVIPYAYDYLFKWYPTSLKLRGTSPATERVPLLYTLYEVDSPHPERLEAWLERQKGIARVDEEARFGGIFVQRRTRYEN